MQVQYETRLLDSEPAKSLLANIQKSGATATVDSYVLANQTWRRPTIEHIASSPISRNLIAVHQNSSNQIILFDPKSKKERDRFPLKAFDKRFSRHSVGVRGLAFSPDGSRLAVGQTDCIIYVYKLPSNLLQHNLNQAQSQNQNHRQPQSQQPPSQIESTTQNQRPTITGKFVCNSPVTCLIWPEPGIAFGTQDGKVKLVVSSSATKQADTNTINPATTTTTNQPSHSTTSNAVTNSGHQPSSITRVITLYQSEKSSSPISMCFRPPNTIMVSFLSSKLVLISTQSGGELQDSSGAVSTARSPLGLSTSGLVTTMSWCAGSGQLICGQSDGRIAVVQVQTTSGIQQLFLVQTLELQREDIVGIEYSAVNEVLAIVTSSKLMFAKCETQQPQDETTKQISKSKNHDNNNNQQSGWQLQPATIKLEGAGANASGVTWCQEGCQLALGCLDGSLHLLGCRWMRESVGEQLEICHIAKNRIRLTDKGRNLLATFRSRHDIKRVNLLDQGRSVLVWTSQSLMLSRLPVGGSTNSNSPASSSGGGSGQPTSELDWPLSASQTGSGGPHKFCFENPGYVLIHQTTPNRIYLVRLGEDAVIYSLEWVGPPKSALISARRFPAARSSLQLNFNTSYRTSSARTSPAHSTGDNSMRDDAEDHWDEGDAHQDEPNRVDKTRERLVYVRPETSGQSGLVVVVVVDLTDKSERRLSVAQQVRWLELSHSARWIAMIDKSEQLYLVDLERKDKIQAPHLIRNPADIQPDKPNVNQQLTPIESNCYFACWLPETDSLVAQSGPWILVWYHFRYPGAPSQVKLDVRQFNATGSPALIDLSLMRESNRKPYPLVRGMSTTDGLQLHLSNGHTAPLDGPQVMFEARLLELSATGAKLDRSLLELAKGEASGRLASRLGWLAIERSQPSLAMAAFEVAAGHPTPLVNHLANCKSLGGRECRIRLAKLAGRWASFERLAEPERVVADYRRLNRWSQQIKFLDRLQRFRQRDLAESEWRAWLVARGRLDEAARAESRSSGLLAGVAILTDRKRWSEAADLILSDQQQQVTHNGDARRGSGSRDPELMAVCEHLVAQLKVAADHKRAGLILWKVLDRSNQALEHLEVSQALEEALDLACSSVELAQNKQQIVRIQRARANQLLEQHRKWLINRKEASKAIDLFLQTSIDSGSEENSAQSAIEAAIELNYLNRARELFRELSNKLPANKKASLSIRLADGFSRRQEWPAVSECLELGGQYGELVERLLSQRKYKEAFRLAYERLGPEQTRLKFSDLAKQLTDKLVESEIGNPEMVTDKNQNQDGVVTGVGETEDAAEEVLLLLERADDAIELRRRRNQPDRMLELVERFRPEALETELLQVARACELSGDLESAERHLLRASPGEWPNVVRMYRLANRCDQAFRVANIHCEDKRDPLLVQLAYWWARSVAAGGAAPGGPLPDHQPVNLEAARELLDRKLGLLKEVVEFCCQNRNFEWALRLATTEGELARSEVACRWARHLEAEGRFERAEQVLMAVGHLELAIKMQLDNGRHEEAIRLAEMAHNGGVGEQDSSLPLKGEPTAREHKRDRKYEPDLLQKTLVQAARMLAEGVPEEELHLPAGRDRLQQAQRWLLRAQKPELAVEMFQVRRMWEEASRVAQRFAPHLLAQVEETFDAQMSSELGSIVSTARQSRSTSGGSDHNNRRSSVGVDFSTGSVSDLLERLLEGGQTKFSIEWLIPGLNRLVEASKNSTGSEEQTNSLPVDKVIKLSEMVAANVAWGCHRLVGEAPESDREIWVKLRNFLAAQYRCQEGHARQMLRPVLLLAHHVSLHFWLVEQLTLPEGPLNPSQLIHLVDRQSDRSTGQLTLDLIGKLALSILRSVHLLEPVGAFFAAGSWLLASERRPLARLVLTRLVELLDEFSRSQSSTPGEPTKPSQVTRELQLAGLPTISFSLSSAASHQGIASRLMSAPKQAELRNWLLGELMRTGAPTIELDERGLLESSIAKRPPATSNGRLALEGATSTELQMSPSLVTGFPVFESASDRMKVGEELEFELLHSEWDQLRSLAASREASLRSHRVARRSKQQSRSSTNTGQMDDVIAFMISLGGSSLAHTPLPGSKTVESAETASSSRTDAR